MTQPVVNPAATASIPVAASPPAGQPGLAASEQGEPTIEELAALVGEPREELATPAEQPAAAEETTEPTAPAEETQTAAAPEVDAALERAERAAAKAREGSRRFRETQEQLRISAQRQQQAAHEAEQLRRENAAARQREQQLLADPYKALKDRGMTDEQLAQRAMRENSPEALVMQLQERLQAESAARVALEQRLENEQRAARAAQQRQQAEAAFFDAAKDAESFPELAVRRPAVQLVAAREALAQMQANGYATGHLTNAQIAEAAEIWLAGDAKAKKAEKAAAPAAKPAAPKLSGKTLTNAQAQTRTAAPAGWDTLSEDQQIAHLAAQLPEPT